MCDLTPDSQFEGSGGNQDSINIVIGLDFGTSTTKVVLQEPGGRDAYLVPFGQYRHQANEFLLPSRLVVKRDGSCHLAEPNQNNIRGLKRALMIDGTRTITIYDFTVSMTELATAFLSLVLRYTRTWFLNNLEANYGPYRIIWQMNLGIPTKNYADHEIYNSFLTAARAAWWLSIQEHGITLERTREAVNHALSENTNIGIHRDLINVVPEVAAEVGGYARSPQRRPGLHAMMDVGATTADISTFRINAVHNEFTYRFLYAEVSTHACYDLHNRRIAAIQAHLNDNFDEPDGAIPDIHQAWLNQLKNIDEWHGAIPDTHEFYGYPQIDFQEIDEEFLAQAVVSLIRTIAITRTHRDPNASAWLNGLPLFVCGGGSRLAIFNENFIHLTEEGLLNFIWAGFHPVELPVPERLRAGVDQGVDPACYHRFAVAYGLSFFYPDIGETVPDSEAEDIPRQQLVRNIEDQYVRAEDT